MTSFAAAAIVAAVIGIRASEQTTVKTGVYSRAQADRGKELWTKACASCHTLGELSTSTKAPALSGGEFLTKWDGKTVFALANGIQTTMPNDFSMELTAAQATDLTALILQVNGFPAGDKELASGDGQKTITIVK